jgi:hypothetical protein
VAEATTDVALLRGATVGGAAKVDMVWLRRVLDEAGCAGLTRGGRQARKIALPHGKRLFADGIPNSSDTASMSVT